MISVVKFLKRMAGASIFGIIISKLYYKKKLCPIILFKINKSLKVDLHYTILSLSLTICLKIKGG